ncbi:uncharacterized protein LOC143035815 [Oratosquilla oratoria]|uniref:uncharacterized protein LOC143035815 n=1 Tax=Oratosquilla oratoria TaxID=337810 RepID=UPI003F772C98
MPSHCAVSSMLFAMLDFEDVDEEGEGDDITLEESKDTLENCIEIEALRYVGGFIAKKFPQYNFLASEMIEKETWVDFICQIDNGLKSPSVDFFKALQQMEKIV